MALLAQSQPLANGDGVGLKPKPSISPVLLSEIEENLDKSISLDISDSSTAKARGGSLKRVSFGNVMATNVQTFIYENVQIPDDRIESRPSYHYTSPPPPASPTRMTVSVGESQVPCSIEPPAEIGLLLSDGSVTPAAALLAPNSSANSPPIILATTITAPSLPRRMEEHDNPFRPEGSLRTEVEPIIEGFKTKPYAAGKPTATTNTVSPPTSPAPVASLRSSRPQVVPFLPSLVHVPLDTTNTKQEDGVGVTLVDGARKPRDDDDVIRKISPPSSKSMKSSSKDGQKVKSPTSSREKRGSEERAAPSLLSTTSSALNGQVEHTRLIEPGEAGAATYAELVHLDDVAEAQKRRKCCGTCCCCM